MESVDEIASDAARHVLKDLHWTVNILHGFVGEVVERGGLGCGDGDREHWEGT